MVWQTVTVSHCISASRYVTLIDTVVEADSSEGTETGPGDILSPRYLLYTR